MNGLPAAIVFSGGFGHPFAESSPVLCALAQRAGFQPAIEEDLDAAIGGLPGADLLVVNALYWSMTQAEKYEPHRAEWARTLSDAQLAAIENFVDAGGKLMVLHTGTICWDTQPGWRAIMGGGWQWGVSHHPEIGPVEVLATDAGLALSPAVPAFTVNDEVYHNLGLAGDCRVLATSALNEGPQPVAWLRSHGAGRVAVDSLGHDAASLETAGHSALILSMLRWLKAGATHAID